jgi:hypothetical protein
MMRAGLFVSRLSLQQLVHLRLKRRKHLFISALTRRIASASWTTLFVLGRSSPGLHGRHDFHASRERVIQAERSDHHDDATERERDCRAHVNAALLLRLHFEPAAAGEQQ